MAAIGTFRRGIASLIILSLAVLSVGLGHAQQRPAGVAVSEVKMRDIAETVPVFAEVVTARDGIVAARVSGTVAEVHVLVGVSVAEGGLLVTLDTDLAQIELRQAEARLAEARAGVTTAAARLNRLLAALERVERLRGTTSFSQGRFEEAEGEVFTAEGQMAEAEARVTTAEASIAEVAYRIEQAQVKAPFPGTVLGVETNPGEFIGSGAPIVRLLDTRSLEVEALVPSRFISGLSEGTEVIGVTETGSEMPLIVRAVLPLEDVSTRTRPVRFVPRSADGLNGAAVGQSVTVDVPAAPPRTVLAVPKDALVQARGGWTVFVDEDATAQPRNIEVGAPMGEWFEVLSGLAEGDQVVVRGNERLQPGQPIAASPAAGQ